MSNALGKSTIINGIAEEEVMRTSEVRKGDSRGRHTTNCFFDGPDRMPDLESTVVEHVKDALYHLSGFFW